MSSAPTASAKGWDIFCRVVDNFGDVGVCWRLACGLAARGLAVRLFIDDASALQWMAGAARPAEIGGVGLGTAPDVGRVGSVQLLPWPDGENTDNSDNSDGNAQPLQPGAVVIEAFGCDPPPAFVTAMATEQTPPLWLNLEYLSAEAYVEASHGLPSPQACGLTKWFYFPGFTPRSGGLLREPGLLQARAVFQAAAWLAQHGLARRPGERVVSLFCYDNAALPALLSRLAEQPTLLLLTPGPAQQALVPELMHELEQPGQNTAGGLRLAPLPWLTQVDYDHLLWACDLNFVRGEDSLVRALWAGAPCVWQLYPQHDCAHQAKLEAWLTQWQAPADVAALMRAWNGLPGSTVGALPAWPAMAPWQQAAWAWRERLAGQDDLVTQLLGFVSGKTRGSSAAHC